MGVSLALEKASPLGAHGFCYARICGGSIKPPVFRRAQTVLSAVGLVRPPWPAIHEPWLDCIGRISGQWRQSVQPESRRLARVVTELVWMNHLIRWPDSLVYKTSGRVLDGNRKRKIQ